MKRKFLTLIAAVAAAMALALVVGEPIANLYLQLCGLR